MTWTIHHAEASRLASEASRLEDPVAASLVYLEAALAELRALAQLDRSKTRTYAITAVSAVALYFKANLHADAEQLARRFLADTSLPPFARRQLDGFLREIGPSATPES